MKKSDLLHMLSSFLLTALLSISAVFCLQGAYSFEMNTQFVLGVCLLSAVAACLLGRSRRAVWLLVPLTLLALRELWILGLADHTEAVIWYISVMLEKVYHTGFIIWWTHKDHLGYDTTAFFMALGMTVSLVTGLGLSRRKSIPGILAGVISLVPCLFITDLTPEPVWLMILLGVLLTLYLIRRVLRTDPENSSGFSLKAAVCIALVLCLIAGAFPPGSYEAPEDNVLMLWLDKLESMLQPTEPISPPIKLPGSSGGSGGTTGFVNLKQVGFQSFSQQYAFEITCSEAGWQYLRSASYDTYSGTSWKVGASQEEFFADSAFLSGQDQSVQINILRPSLVNHLIPYYLSSVTLENGFVPHKDSVVSYRYTYQPLRNDWKEQWQQRFDGPISAQQWDVDSTFLALPDSTRSGAAQYLQQLGITDSTNVLEAAQLIENFVRSSARYNLTTPWMPDEETDFALWFLADSERGYCVHFATAATVLLRAAGIPARYVEGYLVETTADVTRRAFMGNAHAWTEFYLPGLGWTVLETTPGSTGSEPDPTEPTTEPTAPTTQPTEPTTEPTLPPPTRPTQPSVPPTTGGPATEPTTPMGPGKEPLDLSWLWNILRVIAQIAAVIAALWLQWWLRLKWLMYRLHRGTPNAQALARWRHTLWLTRLRRKQVPRELLALANKAKFSQHTLTHRELRQFDLYRAKTVDDLRKHNMLLQLVYRLILALY